MLHVTIQKCLLMLKPIILFGLALKVFFFHSASRGMVLWYKFNLYLHSQYYVSLQSN